MDLAYDHIQEEAFPKEDENNSGQSRTEQQQNNTLNADFQEAYRAFSSSPWGAKIGGFFGNVVKQGESVYKEASQELAAVGQDATTGLSSLRDTLINRTRSLSLTATGPQPGGGESSGEPSSSSAAAATADNRDREAATPTKDMSADEALKESETVLSRLRLEAAKRLKDLQKAEDAADEALLRFGSNLRDFLKDAINIAPPSGANGAGAAGGGGSTVLFESKDAQGKRVIHASRFDAQMHVIHTTTENFVRDPTGTGAAEYDSWTRTFDIDSKTADIAGDLAKYPELRATMEKLVPDQIPYADFWKRYYFLRHGIETAEARRRDLLKAASAEEEVGWDEDSDDEASGPSETAKAESKTTADRPASTESSTTIHPPSAAAAAAPAGQQTHLKPSAPRRSNDEKSQADSDISYDVVGVTSGNPSQAPNSPKDSRKGDDSDEEDWE